MTRFPKKITWGILPIIVLGAFGISQAADDRVETQAVSITVEPITWPVVGLRSNVTPSKPGPDRFPVGSRICNNGTTEATGVGTRFILEGNGGGSQAGFSYDGSNTGSVGNIPAGECVDSYFNVLLAQQKNNIGNAREYYVEACDGACSSSNNNPSANSYGQYPSSASTRKLLIESLVSQNRNVTRKISGPGGCNFDFTQCDPAPTNLQVGKIYTYKLYASTSTAYEQVESFITFPSSSFQILSASSIYQTPAGLTQSQPWANACGWNMDYSSRSDPKCVGPIPAAFQPGGKAGRKIVTTYKVRATSATASGSLTSLIYDMSGSSFHYNADYGSPSASLSYSARYPLTTTVNGSGKVASTSSPTQTTQINCGLSDAACRADYPSGTNVTLTATPAPGETFTGWSGDCSGTGGCSVTMSAARNVTATFTGPSYRPLDVSVSGSGQVSSNPAGITCTSSISSDCQEMYTENTSVTLEAAPASGWIFAAWSGACAGTSSACSVTLSEARSVQALFEPAPVITRLLSVTDLPVDTNPASETYEETLPPIGGTVTSSSTGGLNLNCGASCIGEYQDGSTVVITATPDAGYRLASWGGACASSSVGLSGAQTCTIEMTEDQSISVRFVSTSAPNRTLTVSTTLADAAPGGNVGSVTSNSGGISCTETATGTCSASYPEGSEVTLEATATPGYLFAGWKSGGALLDSCSGGADPQTSTTCGIFLDSDRTITANFDPLPSRYLGVEVIGNGSGQVTSPEVGGVRDIFCASGTVGDCSQSYGSDTTITLTATASPGSQFTGWSGACSGTALTCDVSVNQARFVEASFASSFPLEITRTGTGTGKVESVPLSDGIDCGTACQETLPAGQTITLQATPDAGSTFQGWSGDVPGGCSTGTTCALTMDQARGVTATFEIIAEPPVNIVPPTISGTEKTGSTLTADPETWSGAPTPTYTYQWQRCEQLTSPTYLAKWGTQGTADGQFDDPVGGTTDADGNVYVADTINDRIQKFSADGTFISKWGSLGSGNGQFDNPRGVAIDSAGNIYVADTDNNRIQKFSANGVYLSQWGTLGTGDGEFTQTRGIAIDSQDNVYVSDIGNDRVQKFTSSGAFLVKWGSTGSGNSEFNLPAGIATDAQNNVYVTDFGNNRVQKFSSDGTYLAQWGSLGTGDGQFNGPIGAAVDFAGNVYVSDYTNNRIQKFTSAGTFVTKWGSTGTSNGQFDAPQNVFFNPDKTEIYVVEQLNDRIQAFDTLSCADISGADQQTYVPGVDDVGKNLRVRVTGTNAAGTAEAYSTPTGAIVQTYDLSVTKSGSGAGTVETDPVGGGIDCGTDCEETLDSGTTITLKATADTGSKFQGWSGDVPASCGVGATCTFQMDQSRGVTAAFDTIAHPPFNSQEPAVSGTEKTGSTLTANPGTWSGDPTPTLTYQWQRCEAAVSNTTFSAGGNTLHDLALDQAGNIYTVNFASDTVSKLLPNGDPAGAPWPVTVGDGPNDLVLDQDRNVYVANYFSDTVSKITPSGDVFTLSTTGDAPYGIALDAQSNIYTTNTFSNNVTKITPGGAATTPYATTGDTPFGIAIGADGSIFTVNSGDSTVSKFYPDGSPVGGPWPASVGLGPHGIVLDDDGDIYTSNWNANTVSQIAPGGGVLQSWAYTGDGPHDIAIDQAGNLYTADSMANGVTKINPWGGSAFLAGTTAYPRGIAVDSAFNVYTADAFGDGGGNNVTKITQFNCTDIPGAEDPTYVPVSDDAGKQLRVRVTGTNTAGTAEAYSTPTGSIVQTYDLTVTKDGTGTGLVETDPVGGGIDCGTDCEETLDSGTVITLKATANTGSEFTGWSGDVPAGCTTASTCTLTMDQARGVTATFTLTAPVTYNLSVTKDGTGIGLVDTDPIGEGIDCGTDCQETLNSGAAITLRATPSPGSRFAGWSGDVPGSCTSAATCNLTMDQSRGVVATFVQTYHLTVTKDGNGSGTVETDPVGGGIDCGEDCEETLDSGALITLKATADAESTFQGWSGDVPAGCTSSATCTLTMDQARDVIATFTISTFSLQIQKTGIGFVETDPVGGPIDCGATCQANIPVGDTITLRATPAPGWRFAGWSGDTTCTSSTTCTIEMDQARNVTVTFVQTFPLQVSRSGNGAGTVETVPTGQGINCGTDCEETLDSGSAITLRATPDTTSSFQGWSGDVPAGCAISPECTLQMDQARNVTATFTKNTVSLTVQKSGTGSGIVSGGPINCGATCQASLEQGSTITLQATAASGSKFQGWGGDGASCGTAPTCTIEMSQARSVVAAFSVVYVLEVSSGGSGSGNIKFSIPGIECGASCQELLDADTVVTLTAEPEPGSTFVRWEGSCKGVGTEPPAPAPYTCTLRMSEAESVRAIFANTEAEMKTSLRISDRTLKPGQRVTQTMIVRNTGNVPLTSVRVECSICKQMALQKASQSSTRSTLFRAIPEPSGDKVTWKLDHILPGKTARFRIKVRALRGPRGKVSCPALAEASEVGKQRHPARFRILPSPEPPPPPVTG